MAKKVNEELNLTPFIDLFSTLVCFLLLTAVWNQINALSTNSEQSTASSTPQPNKNEIQLSVTLLENEVQMLEGKNLIKISNLGRRLDLQRMIPVLKRWKQSHPKKQAVTLNTQNSIPYGNMIETFDAIVGADFSDVGVNTQ